MEAGSSQASQAKRISREWKQTAARPARQKDKQGMEADSSQATQQGKMISRKWKQTAGRQARQKDKQGMESDRSQASQAKG